MSLPQNPIKEDNDSNRTVLNFNIMTVTLIFNEGRFPADQKSFIFDSLRQKKQSTVNLRVTLTRWWQFLFAWLLPAYFQDWH